MSRVAAATGTAAVKAAPKSFNQLRLAVQFSVFLAGVWVGSKQRAENRKLWDDHFKAKWAKNYADQEAEAAKHRVKDPSIPDEIPLPLHGLYKSLAGGDEEKAGH